MTFLRYSELTWRHVPSFEVHHHELSLTDGLFYLYASVFVISTQDKLPISHATATAPFAGVASLYSTPPGTSLQAHYPMLRSLTAQNGPGANIEIHCSRAVLGRAGPKADVALPDHPLLQGLVSRQHALLQLQEGSNSMLVTDMSLNGTWALMPGQKLQRLSPGVPTPVTAGSTL